MNCDPAALLDASLCFRCIPAGMQSAVQLSLICQWANKPSGPIFDPDAQAFITAAALVDPVKQVAINQLVLDLKNTVPATTPGSSFWSRDVLIYPMVADGPTYPLAQQGVNLKTPGTYNLLQPGGAPLYSDRGIQGVKAVSSYLNTQYTPPLASQDDIRIMWYMDVDSNAINDMYFGTQNAVPIRTVGICTVTLGRPFNFDINTFTGLQSAAGAAPLGAYFIERNPASVGQGWCAYGAAATFTKIASASSTPPAFPLFLFATNQAGGGPALPAQSRLSGFSLGSALSDAERLQYKTIWDTFENALGRAHP